MNHCHNAGRLKPNDLSQLIARVRKEWPDARLAAVFVPGRTYGDGTPKPKWRVAGTPGDACETPEQAWADAYSRTKTKRSEP